MSEQNRSRLYAWLCDETDEPLAEYVMSCLAPAPLSDLVTKDHLSAELSRFATKEEMQAGFDKLAARSLGHLKPHLLATSPNWGSGPILGARNDGLGPAP